jgi:hypothetical protein
VRVAWGDVHGLMRAKALTLPALRSALMQGVGMVSTAMLKDSSDRTAFKVFEPGGTASLPGFGQANNLVLLPDPASLQVLPWLAGTGWMRAQPWFADGTPVALDPRRVLQRSLQQLAAINQIDRFSRISMQGLPARHEGREALGIEQRQAFGQSVNERRKKYITVHATGGQRGSFCAGSRITLWIGMHIDSDTNNRPCPRSGTDGLDQNPTKLMAIQHEVIGPFQTRLPTLRAHSLGNQDACDQ